MPSKMLEGNQIKDAIRHMDAPQTVTQLRSYLGMVAYYRTHLASVESAQRRNRHNNNNNNAIAPP